MTGLIIVVLLIAGVVYLTPRLMGHHTGPTDEGHGERARQTRQESHAGHRHRGGGCCG